MKRLSLVIPCYNSEAYLERCLDSLLPAIEALEVIVVNDGSTDQTQAIAESYALRFPEHLHVISQENKGHGGAVNTGLAAATGQWFKILDSDDRFEHDALLKLLRFLKRMDRFHPELDLVLHNFVYEIHREDAPHPSVIKRPVSYANLFKEEGVPQGWNDLRTLRLDQNLMMHALCYKRSCLSGLPLVLPEHCFYEDNLYVTLPLRAVHSMAYCDADLYEYYIGRKDQSVNPEVLLRHIDDQILVTFTLLHAYDFEAVRPMPLRRLLYRHLVRMVSMSLIPMSSKPQAEAKAMQEAFWARMQEEKPGLSKRLRAHPLLRSQELLSLAGAPFNAQLYQVVARFMQG